MLAPNPAMMPQQPMQPQQPPAPKWHDITIIRKRKKKQCKILGVPPEEFGISRNARSLRDCGYCFHEVLRRQEELISDGYDKDMIRKLPTYNMLQNPEQLSRDTVDEHLAQGGDGGINSANRLIKITEHYVRMDYEQNGKVKLYRVVTGGDQGDIMRREGANCIDEVDEIPFACMTPVIVTHRFFGRSIADLVMDIQRIKTTLLRSILDNAYLSANPRAELAESGATDNTLDDLLVSRPGGVVRVKVPGTINWQEVPFIGQQLFPLVEYIDATREWRTGVSRAGQGLDANALQNQSATAANQLFTAAQARMKLIARIFAETGIRDLFQLVHAIVRKHGSQAETVRLRNNWVEIDPREWKERYDMTVNVGLGTGSKAEQTLHLDGLIMLQEKAIMGGAPIVSMTNLYNSAKERTKLSGFKNPDAFFVDPSKPPDPKNPMSAPIQKPPDPKAQADQAKVQADAAHQKMKAEADIGLAQAKFKFDATLEQQKFEHTREIDLIKAGHDREKHAHEMAGKELDLFHKDAAHEHKVDEHGMKMEAAAAKTISSPGNGKAKPSSPPAGPLTSALSEMAKSHKAMADALVAHTKPKRIKAPSGKVYTIEQA